MGGFNGNGVFQRSYSWATDAANSVNISSTRMDTEDNGFASGLTNCITRDGQSPALAPLPMSGFNFTGLGVANSAGQAVEYAQFLATTTALAGSGGSSSVGFVQAGTGAVLQALQNWLRNRPVSPTDYGAVGDGVTDDTAAVQAAITYATSIGKSVFVPMPSVAYLISSTINVTCSMIGETPTGTGSYSGQFLATTEFTAFNVYGTRLRIENLSVHFQLGGLATTAVGFLFGNSTTQFSRSLCKNLLVRNAYDGFKTNLAGSGTIWGTSFETCSADLYVHRAFHFDAVNGSTTVQLDQCYGVATTASSNKGKGFYFNNISDVICGSIYADSVFDEGLSIADCNNFSAQSVRFEGPNVVTNSATLITCVASNVTIGRVYVTNLTVNISGHCGVIVPAGQAGNQTLVGQMFIQFTTITSGTLYKYQIGSLSFPGNLVINDPLCSYSDIFDNGYVVLVRLNGRYALSGFGAMLGSWTAGDFVWNTNIVEGGSATAKYVKLGWSRATTGSGNVLNTDWYEAHTLTGN